METQVRTFFNASIEIRNALEDLDVGDAVRIGHGVVNFSLEFAEHLGATRKLPAEVRSSGRRGVNTGNPVSLVSDTGQYKIDKMRTCAP